MTVLVVDDSIMIRSAMREMIGKLGHKVILATNGEESIKIYQEEKIDIVTMDLTMPRMGGIIALRNLVLLNPRVKVIISTSNGFNEIVLQAMKEGASGYLLKPIEIDTLESAINNVISEIKKEKKK